MDDGLHDSLGRFGGKDGGRGLRSLMCMGMIMETTGRRERCDGNEQCERRQSSEWDCDGFSK